MIQLLDEIFQFQMIGCIELLSQFFGHETIEIGTHHFPADVHTTAFVADEITQRNGSFNNVVTIVNT